MKATLKGKEIKVIGKNAIEAIFTEKVQELISQGMTFSFTDRGHQGEITKTDLTKDGKTIYRVLCTEDRIKIDEKFWNSIRTVIIQVRKYDDVRKNSILWNNEGEVIFEKAFFNIIGDSYDYSKAFVEDLELLKEIMSVQNERSQMRWSMKKDSVKLPESWNKKVLKIVRNRKGYKTVNLEDIQCVTKEFRNKKFLGFRVMFEGKKADLWIEPVAK